MDQSGLSIGEEYDFLFKIVLVGDSGVGKSNIETRFTKNQFNISSKSTIGVEFAGKTIEKHGKRIRSQIWDTAGQERFRALGASYYRNASGVIIVYDVTHRTTFEHVATWMEEAKQNSPSNVVLMIVGNKTDKTEERAVATLEGKELAEKSKCLFVETSALNGDNIEYAFNHLVDTIFQESSPSDVNVDPSATSTQRLEQGEPIQLDKNDNEQEEKKSCCT